MVITIHQHNKRVKQEKLKATTTAALIDLARCAAKLLNRPIPRNKTQAMKLAAELKHSPMVNEG